MTISLDAPLPTIADAILVPQGWEYKSVCRGLKRTATPTPPVFPIPVGTAALTQYLEKWQKAGHLSHHSQPKVLLMGLCGSLTPQYSVGNVVLYQSCIYPVSQLEDDRSPQPPIVKRFPDIPPLPRGAKPNPNTVRLTSPPAPLLRGEGSPTPPFPWREGGLGGLGLSAPKSFECDPELTAMLQGKLKERAIAGIGLTSDRVIYSATEKQHLGQLYGADVVDMEGFAALEVLSQAGIAVAMLRVISDDSHHDIPNLTSAFSADGSLKALSLATGLLRQPIAATRLIRGALQGLQVLQDLTNFLFSDMGVGG